QFNSEDFANQIVSEGIWKDIEVATPDPTTLTFTFKQPFSPFLYTSTEPIFPYGPYKITKENKNEVELSARDDYYAGRPYIDKIIFRLYPDQNSLLKAAKRGEIDGFALTTDTEMLSNFQKFEMKLPRQLTIFFNLSNKDLQDINVRKALKENSNPGKALELRLVTSSNQKNVDVAKAIADKWGKNGIKVNLDIKDNVTLQKTVIPKRDFDVLLYGLDYGEDPDPYPFWHSSQIKEDGKNLSNFKNVQGDKLLEDARQEFDFKKREEKYAQFQQILNQEIPAFVVEQDNLYYQVSKDVKGIDKIVGSLESDRFLEVAKWYINTKRVKK
ncbi:MAG: ABC transporter substrate-binding protein, partial [Patescibacteria group bacterium]|nr:ABC transporter substrate-binding protein [Patescibacteria group bacterium]